MQVSLLLMQITAHPDLATQQIAAVISRRVTRKVALGLRRMSLVGLLVNLAGIVDLLVDVRTAVIVSHVVRSPLQILLLNIHPHI